MSLRIRILYLWAALLLQVCGALSAQAQVCSENKKPQCDECNEAVCTKSADDKRPLWDCQPKTAGKVCDTGHCDGKGVCIGVPGTPGGIKGPSTSATRSFFLSWGPSTGVVDKYVLYQNGAQIFTGDKSVVSRGVLVQSDGAYRYHVQACNSAGCSAATPDLIVTVHLPPAQLCSGTKPTCEECNVAVCVAADTHYWDCVPKSAGQACKTGDACYKNGHCDGQGVCIGTLSCVPGTPGAIKGPSNSATGSFVLSWGPSTGVVDKYVLYQNGAQSFTGDQSVVSRSVLVQTDGAYNYHVQACNSAGCSPATPDFLVTVLQPPGVPAINAPRDTGPSYTVTWSVPAGFVDHYNLRSRRLLPLDPTTWITISQSSTSQAFEGQSYGDYLYQVQACNSSGCSAYSQVTQVSVITPLTSFPDAPVVPPSVAIPLQAWVGMIPGSPSVEGGAAIYRIPIEVPPGRAGMTPEISLAYSSRNGNGVAGMGWSISTRSTIYRCPRTLAQDGGNRTVQHNQYDRLCLDGQRLVASNDASYGKDSSEYRTEIDQFARIILHGGDTSAWSSYFEVEQKSGRIAEFEAGPSMGSTFSPDMWYLVAEFDRQGNCISYNYSTLLSRGSDQDRELTSITYTGIRKEGTSQCVTDSDSRTVQLSYGSRGDRRTTFRYGVGSIMGSVLTAISTKVGSLYVRRYELAYHSSATTGRYLLESITLCAGGDCNHQSCLPHSSNTRKVHSLLISGMFDEGTELRLVPTGQ